jgi:hypothetical protein
VARSQGGRLAAIFYAFGHPTSYAYSVGEVEFTRRKFLPQFFLEIKEEIKMTLPQIPLQ